MNFLRRRHKVSHSSATKPFKGNPVLLSTDFRAPLGSILDLSRQFVRTSGVTNRL